MTPHPVPQTRILPVHTRVYSDVPGKRAKNPRKSRQVCTRVFIPDVETTTDYAQRGLMAAGGLYQEQWNPDTRALTLNLIRKVACYWVDLPDNRPLLFKTLSDYCRANIIELLTSDEFVDKYIYRLGYSHVFEDYQQGTVTNANISFDLTRFITTYRKQRGFYYGGIGGELHPDYPS